MTAGSDRGFGPDGLNRRRAPRIAMPASGGPVTIVGARVVNVSPYGAMIESPVPMERDATLALRIVVAGRKVDVQARVAACSLIASAPRKSYGVGLEFVGLARDVGAAIADALAAYAAGAR